MEFDLPLSLEEYRYKNIWLNYCIVENNKLHSGIDKPPINPHNLKAGNTTDLQQCTDFNTAVSNIGKSTVIYYTPFQREIQVIVSGVGVNLEQAGFIGIDLDGVVNKDTGEIDQQALKTVEYMDSYTEYSISGTGLHILVKGCLKSADLNKRGLAKGIKYKFDNNTEYEIYSNGKYFTFSGNSLTSSGISDNERKANSLYQRLNALRNNKSRNTSNTSYNQQYINTESNVQADDNKLLEQMFNSSVGNEIKALYYGDNSAYSSQSEADLKLCYFLAYFTGKDKDRIDRLFRQSALYRPKWDREDYRTNTISKAVELSGTLSSKTEQEEYAKRHFTAEERKEYGKRFTAEEKREYARRKQAERNKNYRQYEVMIQRNKAQNNKPSPNEPICLYNPLDDE